MWYSCQRSSEVSVGLVQRLALVVESWCHRAGGVQALSPGLITTMPHYSLWIKVVIKHKPHFPIQRPNQTACIQFLHSSPQFVPFLTEACTPPFEILYLSCTVEALITVGTVFLFWLSILDNQNI